MGALRTRRYHFEDDEREVAPTHSHWCPSCGRKASTGHPGRFGDCTCDDRKQPCSVACETHGDRTLRQAGQSGGGRKLQQQD